MSVSDDIGAGLATLLGAAVGFAVGFVVARQGGGGGGSTLPDRVDIDELTGDLQEEIDALDQATARQLRDYLTRRVQQRADDAGGSGGDGELRDPFDDV